MPAKLYIECAVDPGGADEVVQGQAADTVGAEFNPAGIVVNDHLGMVVLLVGNHGDDINKRHGFVIVFEFEGTTD
jgi:hypothetical protein